MAMIVWHWHFGWETKYEIVQHRYGCTDIRNETQGFAEILEVKDHPDAKGKILIHIWRNGQGSTYFEFVRLIDADNAYTKILLQPHRIEVIIEAIAKEPGFLFYNHTPRTPWFYEV